LKHTRLTEAEAAHMRVHIDTFEIDGLRRLRHHVRFEEKTTCFDQYMDAPARNAQRTTRSEASGINGEWVDSALFLSHTRLHGQDQVQVILRGQTKTGHVCVIDGKTLFKKQFAAGEAWHLSAWRIVLPKRLNCVLLAHDYMSRRAILRNMGKRPQGGIIAHFDLCNVPDQSDTNQAI
jgi:hypothetical protein